MRDLKENQRLAKFDFPCLSPYFSRTPFQFLNMLPIKIENSVTDPGCLQLETLTEGVSSGVDLLRVELAANFTAILLPTRGLGLQSVQVGSQEFAWRSPQRRPVHPQFVDMGEPNGLGWLDGFTELLVRCGLTSNGAPEHDDRGQLVHPLHGRIANLPAHSLEACSPNPGVLEVSGCVDEIRFHLDKWRLRTTYRFFEGQARIQIEDRVENLAGTRRDFQMLYHYNLGQPLLDAGSRIHVPHRKIAPRNAHAASGQSQWSVMPAPQSGFEEQVYFFSPLADENGRSLAVLENAAGTAASAIEFAATELSCFSLWKNPVAEADGYVVGLEPATNYPNPKSIERKQGRTVWLEPGDSHTITIDLHFATDAAATRNLVDRVQSIQSRAKPEVVNEI